MYAHIPLNNVDPNKKAKKSQGSRGAEEWFGGKGCVDGHDRNVE